MSTIHIIQTIAEILLLILLVLCFIYEPMLVKWEEKQKVKVLKALKEKKKGVKENVSKY